MTQDTNDENWECYLCAREDTFDIMPSAYLDNYHPLYYKCAKEILNDKNHKNRRRLTYHIEIGDMKIVANIPTIDQGRAVLN